MKVLHCLYNSASDSLHLQERLTAIQKACESAQVECLVYDQQTTDFSDLPVLTRADGLYNCARGSRLLECSMINEEVLTLYRNFPGTSVYRDSNQLNIVLEKRGINTPKTIHCGTNDPQLLKKYVELLGFPLVLKTFGGSGGVGTMVVESYQSLKSLSDFLVSRQTDFLLKEFIPSDGVFRITAINGEVVTSFKRVIQPKSDFRTDAIYGEIQLYNNISDDISELAIKAIEKANLYMAGVDVIVHKETGTPYVLEVNLPANFYKEGQYSGVDVYAKMIHFFKHHPDRI
ncbi:MAG: ATP-grasp domain-containing protein [Cytophagia bacterium]|nr:ATP-grasp domain-containing protein [Cytophagia bacterium]